MSDLVLLDGLADVFSSAGERLFVTAAVVGVVAGILVLSRYLQSWLSERVSALVADVATTVILFGSVLGASAVTLGTWGQVGRLVEASSDLPGGREVLAPAALTIVVVVSAAILARFVRRVIRDVLGSSTAMTDHQREITLRLSQVVLWAFASIVVLGLWNVDLSGLLIGAGFLGIVLGMAARQTIGSMIAGFVLMFARPFEIGDWVEIDGDEGIVTDISIVDTRLRTFDGEYLVVPNDVVGSVPVRNRSRSGRLREEIEVGVDYGANLDVASDLALEATRTVDAVLERPKPHVVTKRFGDSAIVIAVRFWIDSPTIAKLNRTRTAVVGAIKEDFDQAGIKIPYPQRELSGREEQGGLHVASDRETARYDEEDGERAGTTIRGDGVRADRAGERDAE